MTENDKVIGKTERIEGLIEELRKIEVKNENDLSSIRSKVLEVLKLQGVEESFFVGMNGSLISFLCCLHNSGADVVGSVACMLTNLETEEKEKREKTEKEASALANIEKAERIRRESLSVETLLAEAEESAKSGKYKEAYGLAQVAIRKIRETACSQ